jgi:hypothetical protein
MQLLPGIPISPHLYNQLYLESYGRGKVLERNHNEKPEPRPQTHQARLKQILFHANPAPSLRVSPSPCPRVPLYGTHELTLPWIYGSGMIWQVSGCSSIAVSVVFWPSQVL